MLENDPMVGFPGTQTQFQPDFWAGLEGVFSAVPAGPSELANKVYATWDSGSRGLGFRGLGFRGLAV